MIVDKEALLNELRENVQQTCALRGYVDTHSAARMAARKARALEIIAILQKG